MDGVEPLANYNPKIWAFVVDKDVFPHICKSTYAMTLLPVSRIHCGVGFHAMDKERVQGNEENRAERRNIQGVKHASNMYAS